MAVGKNKGNKAGKRSGKKKAVEPMLRKEWYDVVAPQGFKVRQFGKTICNKTQGIKLAADNLKGRVYEACLADLEQSSARDQPFRKMKFLVQEIQGRNLLTQFHSMNLATDKLRSLIRKWCTQIEAVIEAKTSDGYVLRVFVIAFTARQQNQLSKNCYAKQRLVKWIRSRMTKMVTRALSRVDLTTASVLLSNDSISDQLFRRCNPIFPLRDVKIHKVKVVRQPKLDGQKFLDSHGEVPASREGEGREVEVAAVAEVAAE